MFKRTMLAFAVAVAAGVVTPTPAFAKSVLPPEPSNFTLEVALQGAIRNNPNIQAAEARLMQAKLEKENQDLWWARTLRANANYNVLGNQQFGGGVTPDGVVLPTAALGVGFNLGDLLAGPKNSERAQQAVIIAQADLRRTTLEVASQVTAAYQEYQAAKQVATLTGDMVQAAEADMRIAERQFQNGLAQVNTVLGSRVTIQRVRADSYTSAGNVAKAWTALLNLMGSPEWLPNTNAADAADRR